MTGDTSISMDQFHELAKAIYQETGIHLHEGKMELVRARIAKRLRVTGVRSASEYVQRIRKDEDEFMNFVDAMTTNHTFFFRENKHCEFLLRQLPPGKLVKVWSAACSSGEEPYTIGMQLDHAAIPHEINATDISDTMLKFAVRGIYPVERVRAVPQPMLHKYFQKGKNRWTDHVRVKDGVRKSVRFGKFNLVSDQSRTQYDIIFCRNVMIYFDDRTKQLVVDCLLQSLRSGGYFVIGMSESLIGIRHDLKHVSDSLYRK